MRKPSRFAPSTTINQRGPPPPPPDPPSPHNINLWQHLHYNRQLQQAGTAESGTSNGIQQLQAFPAVSQQQKRILIFSAHFYGNWPNQMLLRQGPSSGPPHTDVALPEASGSQDTSQLPAISMPEIQFSNRTSTGMGQITQFAPSPIKMHQLQAPAQLQAPHTCGTPRSFKLPAVRAPPSCCTTTSAPSFKPQLNSKLHTQMWHFQKLQAPSSPSSTFMLHNNKCTKLQEAPAPNSSNSSFKQLIS